MNLLKLAAVSMSLISLAACGPGGKPPGGGPAGGMPQVSVVTLQSQKVTLTTQLPGRTSAYRVAEIRPQVSGLIQKRLFTEGALVKAGDALYQIDPAPFQAALDTRPRGPGAVRGQSAGDPRPCRALQGIARR